MSNWRRLAFALVAVAAGLNFVSVNAVGQQITASIRGTVLDPSGAVVQAATVTTKQIETGLKREAITDRQGEYVLVELPIGHYQLEVQAKGFQTYLQQGITLDVNETATVGIHLKLGAETQQVEVNANAILVQSTVTRPNVIGNPNSGPRTPQEWFNVSAFQQLQPDPLGRFEVFGDEGRNAVQGPEYINWDASAFKNIRLTETKELQFRGEVFNTLNHTNLRLPVSDIESPTFGQIQSDVSPRVIQVALKFLF